MTTTIGLIGSGNIGSTVARLAVAAGYDVVLSNSAGTRDPQRPGRRARARARAATAADAAAAGDLVVVTIPLKSYRDVPVAPLRGKVVIDTNNYYPQRDGQIPALDDESHHLGRAPPGHLPESRVVKAFNNIYFGHLARAAPAPRAAADRSALAIAGDDADAKLTVASFLGDLGFDTVDVGALAEGWRYQRDTAAYAGPYNPGRRGRRLASGRRPRRRTRAVLPSSLAEARRSTNPRRGPDRDSTDTIGGSVPPAVQGVHRVRPQDRPRPRRRA